GDVMANLEQARAAIEHLHTVGLRVCLSDFAASHAVLALIREARVRLVRLKRDVSRRVLQEGPYGEELRGVVESLHDEGVEVIATRVNDTAALSALWKADIDLVQGSLLPNLETDAGAGQGEPRPEQSARPLTR